MKILVIGSKGFIGSHCVSIMSRIHEVWGCDVVNDYVDSYYFQIDATNADFKDIFSSHVFDVCINCAGAASVPDSFVSPLKDMSLNALMVMKILDAIRIHCPTCKYINLSSAAVYGNPVELPVKEDMNLAPLSPYGLHKKMSEEIVLAYSRFYQIKTCSLRLFSVFGLGLRKQLFWDFHSKIQKSDHIELWGTGMESRDFIYVEDVVHAISCVISNGRFEGESINVANGIESTIAKAIELFKAYYFKEFSYSFGGQQRMGDPINWRADISLLTSMGYKSEISLETGLKKYIEWLKRETK